MNDSENPNLQEPPAENTRREFLGRVSSLTVAAAAVNSASGHAEETKPAAESLANLLPTIRIRDHRVTKLILGGNPIYGHSHFNRLYSQHLRDYHTPERVIQLLRAAPAPASTPGRTATHNGRSTMSGDAARKASPSTGYCWASRTGSNGRRSSKRRRCTIPWESLHMAAVVSGCIARAG